MTEPFYDEEAEKYRAKKLVDEKNMVHFLIYPFQNFFQSVKKMIGPNGKIMNGCLPEFDVAFGINYTHISNQLMILGDGEFSA